jgi:hypothetical protein
MTTVVDVRDLIGLPFAHGGRMVDGRLPLGGIDCWGLVVEVRRRAGLWSPDPWGCGPDPKEIHPEGLPEEFTRHIVELDGPQDYCCVDLRSPWPGGHAGVLLPSGVVIETNRDAGVVAPPHNRVLRRVRRYLEFAV